MEQLHLPPNNIQATPTHDLHDCKIFKLHYNSIQNLSNKKCLVVRRLLKSRIDGGKFKNIMNSHRRLKNNVKYKFIIGKNWFSFANTQTCRYKIKPNYQSTVPIKFLNSGHCCLLRKSVQLVEYIVLFRI